MGKPVVIAGLALGAALAALAGKAQAYTNYPRPVHPKSQLRSPRAR